MTIDQQQYTLLPGLVLYLLLITCTSILKIQCEVSVMGAISTTTANIECSTQLALKATSLVDYIIL